jgi:hypothetical protein
MVVVDPDEVTRLPDAGEFFGKRLIGLEISFPVRPFRRDLSRDILPEEVVEQRPKCWRERKKRSQRPQFRIFCDVTRPRALTGFAVTLIVSVGDLVIQEYWDVGHLLPRSTADIYVFSSNVTIDRGLEAILVLLCEVRNLDSIPVNSGDPRWAVSDFDIAGPRDDDLFVGVAEGADTGNHRGVASAWTQLPPSRFVNRLWQGDIRSVGGEKGGGGRRVWIVIVSGELLFGGTWTRIRVRSVILGHQGSAQ